MVAIAVTTNAAPLQNPGNTLIDRNPNNGHLYCILRATTANTYDLYRSTNGGTSWASAQSLVRSNLVEMGSIFIGKDGWLRWVYRTNESSEDRIYIRGMNLSTLSWESELKLAGTANGGSAGSVYQGMDLWQTVYGGTEYYAVAVGYTSGANVGIKMLGAYTRPIPSSTIHDDTVIMGTRQWLATGSGRVGPSIDAQHNADGKTASTPNLWVTSGRTGAYVIKLSWNGDGWNGPTSPVTLATGLTAADYRPGRWDGSRFLVAVPNGSNVDLYQRDKSNTTTTLTTSSAHTAGTVRQVTLSYNKVTADCRVFAVGTSNNDLYYTDYIRGTDTWGGWATVTTDDIIGTNNDQFSVRRSTNGDSKYSVAYARAASSQVQHQLLGLAYPPTAPTWNFTAVPYTNGGAADVAASLLLDWDFNDPDAADVQSAYAVKRLANATTEYWNAGTSTWSATEIQNTSATTALTLTATQWSTDGAANGATDPPHTYTVKTWDAAAAASVYSSALVLTPSTKVNPAVTAPTAAQVITTSDLTLTWTATEQVAYKVRLVDATLGEMYNSGWISDSVTRSITVPYVLPNNSSWSVKLTTRNLESLDSTEQSVAFTVLFTDPGTPTTVATPVPASGWISVAITNPALVGSQPVLDHVDLYRRPALAYPALNLNPFFEVDASDWAVASATSFARSTVQFHTGVASGLLTPNGVASTADALTTSFIAVTPGGSYEAAAWIYAPTGATTASAAINWYDASFALVGQVISGYPIPSAQWAYRVNPGVAPTNAVWAKLRVRHGGTPLAANVIYFDEVTLRLSDPSVGVRVGAGLPTGSTVTDWRAVALVSYEYRAFAVGVNGSSLYGPWQT